MRVSLAADIFTEAAALTDLIVLLRAFASGPHNLIAEPKATEVAVQYLRNHAPSLAETYAALAQKGTVAAAWTPVPATGPVIKVTRADLAEHTRDLDRPAILVVEDIDSDQHFIKALCAVFRAERLRRALDNGWIEIAHGGGTGGLQRVAKQSASRFKRVKRVAALLDSDRMVPSDSTTSHAKAAVLRAMGVVVHVLEFREAENYVPNKILAGVHYQRRTHQKLQHLKKLSPAQRAHFDMKHGFGRTNGVPPAQQSLYKNLAPTTVQGLHEGFGTHILRSLEQSSRSLVERDFASLGDDVVAELRTLLDKLTSVI